MHLILLQNVPRNKKEEGLKAPNNMQEHKLISRHDVSIRVLGDLSLLPATVSAAADRVMEATQHHKRGRLNICLSYGCAWTLS